MSQILSSYVLCFGDVRRRGPPAALRERVAEPDELVIAGEPPELVGRLELGPAGLRPVAPVAGGVVEGQPLGAELELPDALAEVVDGVDVRRDAVLGEQPPSATMVRRTLANCKVLPG